MSLGVTTTETPLVTAYDAAALRRLARLVIACPASAFDNHYGAMTMGLEFVTRQVTNVASGGHSLVRWPPARDHRPTNRSPSTR